MTGRARDHFDAVAIILDSYDDIDLERLNEICGSNDLRDIIRGRIASLVREIRSRTLARLWQENTGLVLSGVRANELRKKLRAIEKAIR